MNDGGAAAHHNRSQVESIEIKRVSSASSEEGTGPSVSTASIKQSPSPRHDRFFFIVILFFYCFHAQDKNVFNVIGALCWAVVTTIPSRPCRRPTL